jgi:hypothetical protein
MPAARMCIADSATASSRKTTLCTTLGGFRPASVTRLQSFEHVFGWNPRPLVCHRCQDLSTQRLVEHRVTLIERPQRVADHLAGITVMARFQVPLQAGPLRAKFNADCFGARHGFCLSFHARITRPDLAVKRAGWCRPGSRQRAGRNTLTLLRPTCWPPVRCPVRFTLTPSPEISAQ